MDLEQLFQQQRSQLQHFLSCSEQALSSDVTHTEMDLETLDRIQLERNHLLKNLHQLHAQIQLLIHELPELPESLQTYSEQNQEILQAILEKDALLFQRIEAEKNKVLHELSKSDRNKITLNKFKSTWTAEAGEKLDGKI